MKTLKGQQKGWFLYVFRFFINGFYPFNCFSIYLLFLSLSVYLPYVSILPSFSLFIIRLSPYLFYSLIFPSSLSIFLCTFLIVLSLSPMSSYTFFFFIFFSLSTSSSSFSSTCPLLPLPLYSCHSFFFSLLPPCFYFSILLLLLF